MRTTRLWCCPTATCMDTTWVCVISFIQLCSSERCVINILFYSTVSLVHSSRWQGDMPQDQRGFQLFPGWEGLYYVMGAPRTFRNVKPRRRCESQVQDIICPRASILQPLFHSNESNRQYAPKRYWPTCSRLNGWFRITVELSWAK